MRHGNWFVPARHTATRDAIEHALADSLPRFLPPGPYREFYAWALSEANPDRRAFTRAIALDQLAALTDILLRDLCDPEDWPALLHHATFVNLYQIFEVISDNLALAMFGVNASTRARRDALLAFNSAVIGDLKQPTATPARQLLAPLAPAIVDVSAFDQSLAVDVHARIARRYVQSTGNATIADLEHSVWPGLVGNLEAGRDVLGVMAGTRTEWLVRQSTIDRYQGINRILTTQQLPRIERAAVGAHTIMVVPTLSYLTAGLAELTAKDPGYPSTVDDGSLLEVLADAALLVRLHNDIGTPLLRLPMNARREYIHGLPERYPPEAGQPDTVLRLLTRAAAHEPALNRFHKDLHNGEYNISLCELYSDPGVTEGLATLIDSVDCYAALYRHHRTTFRAHVNQLDSRLDDRRLCALIVRFVMFHEAMYGYVYDDGRGDYAV